MVRAVFSCQAVGDPSCLCPLDHLLKDCFTIIKEFFILKVRQDCPVYELFCTSKTTIQVYRAEH